MRTYPHRIESILALGLALLLVSPSFLVLSAASPASLPAPGASVPSIPSSQGSATNPFPSYKEVGSASPNMSVLVSVAIPLRNLPELSSFVEQSSDPNSLSFRHFLTYADVAQEFLPTEAQYQSVVDSLTSKGFTIESSSLNSMIVARGTVSQVAGGLGQSVELYSNGTYSYYQTQGASSLSGAYSFASNSTGLLMRPDFTTGSEAGSGVIPSANVTFTEGGQDTKILRSVYNSTELLGKGDNGTGYTIGLLDFYGNPLVAQDLALYDKTYGYPAPPSFTVTPIGPYNPNLGLALGWAGEIDLDVQVSHAMAPGANIIEYAGNGELPLAAAIAAVVQASKVNVLSQSFGIPEWEYYEAGPIAFLFNSVFSDDYYMLGSAMGITFLGSTGDGGGSGESAGPEGGVTYPSSSPYVTALGATATYVSTTASGALVVNQTAWSNIGFVPYFENLGGSGGGVSVLEPKPWYQSSLQTPASFANGRMVPDLSLDGSGNPGTYIIYQGSPTATGGTSEASPLFAGLLAVLMGAEKGSFGLVNPLLYQLAQNPKTYQEAFTPITFGYTIPWVSKFGYNMATGWGAPDVGEIAALVSSIKASPSTLAVNVSVLNAGTANFTDYLPGQNISVVANILGPTGGEVPSGTFAATLETLQGASAVVPLTYNAACNSPYHSSDCWSASVPVGDEAGIAYVTVAGNSSTGQSGAGFAPTFVGYLANFVQPIAPYPWTFLPGLVTAVSITNLFGNLTAFNSESVSFRSYSILSNTYTPSGTAVLNYSSSDGYFQATVEMNIPSGVTQMVTDGPVAGFLPFVSGMSLLGSDIYPQVVAEPGSVAPGQSLTIVATVTAPENIYLTESLATGSTIGASMAEGSNVTASLVSPSGHILENVSLAERSCAQALKVCGADLTLINGVVPIPQSASPGLYTVLLEAAYNDETTGFNYTGSYYGQIYVSGAYLLPKVSVEPSTLFEGETATISANITYPSGKEVTNGVYTALVYPEVADGDYSTLMHEAYSTFGLVLLSYDPHQGLWDATVTIPSPSNSSFSSSTNPDAEYYGGPYDVFVSGLSADGVPTASDMSAQQGFSVQPYVWTANTVLNGTSETSRLALSNATVEGGLAPLTLTNDYFVGNDSVSGTDVTISSSSIAGTLNVESGETTLSGVTGGDVVVANSSVLLLHTNLSSLTLLTGATASMDSASTSLRVSPALPTVSISSPVANDSYTGTINASVTIGGGGASSLTFFLDGKRLTTLTGSSLSGPEVSIPLDTSSMPDGTHTLTVKAVQSDLLNSSASVSFQTHNQLAALTGNLASANSTISSLSGSLKTANGDISTLQSSISKLQSTTSTLEYLLLLAAAVAVIAVALGAYALRSGRAPWKY